jgi:AcrR family transcriptional regulator
MFSGGYLAAGATRDSRWEPWIGRPAAGPVSLAPATGTGGGRDELALTMARLAGRQGYGATTVAEVLAASGAERTDFERHFADKLECFLGGHEILVGRALDEVGASFEAERPWLERVCAGLGRAVELCIAYPDLARAVLVEPAAGGAEGRRRGLIAVERFAELIGPESPLSEELPPRAALMAVSGVAGLIGDQLQRGEAAGLAGLAGQHDELRFALLVPLLGPVEASEQAARFAERSRDR